MLGYLDPRFFLGGRMSIDPAASESAVMKRIGVPLALSALRTAWGIHEMINEDVARAFRVHASERGVDYRGCAMVAFGGSGPLHAIRIAQKLKIPKVLLPPGAGVMSALGMLVSPLSFEVTRFRRIGLSQIDPAQFAHLFGAIEEEACAVLAAAKVERSQISIVRTLDMRYVGQGYEIEVRLPADICDDSSIERLRALYSAAYEQLFSISFADKALEIVNWKVEATGPLPIGGGTAKITGFEGSASSLKGERLAYFPEPDALISCPVHDRYSLAVGAALVGPALIEERESTVVVGAGVRVEIDEMLNIVADL